MGRVWSRAFQSVPYSTVLPKHHPTQDGTLGHTWNSSVSAGTEEWPVHDSPHCSYFGRALQQLLALNLYLGFFVQL